MVRHNFDNRAEYTFLFFPSKPENPWNPNLYALFTLIFVGQYLFVQKNT